MALMMPSAPSITPAPNFPMNIKPFLNFSKANNLSLVILEHPGNPDSSRFTAHFEGAEEMAENICHGETPNDAIASYYMEIAGKTVVFGIGTGVRHYVSVPHLLLETNSDELHNQIVERIEAPWRFAHGPFNNPGGKLSGWQAAVILELVAQGDQLEFKSLRNEYRAFVSRTRMLAFILGIDPDEATLEAIEKEVEGVLTQRAELINQRNQLQESKTGIIDGITDFRSMLVTWKHKWGLSDHQLSSILGCLDGMMNLPGVEIKKEDKAEEVFDCVCDHCSKPFRSNLPADGICDKCFKEVHF